MNKYNILKNIAIFFLAILAYLVLFTTLNYFEIISPKVLSVISFIFITILFMYSGFYLANKSESKGYLSGLIMGAINIGILFLISLLLQCDIKVNMLLYFLILTLSSTMGGMFGINFNNKAEKKQ